MIKQKLRNSFTDCIPFCLLAGKAVSAKGSREKSQCVLALATLLDYAVNKVTNW